MNKFIRDFKNLNKNMPKTSLIIYGVILSMFLILIIGKIFRNPYILIMLPALYLAIVPHEVAHGAAANIFGDPTAKIAGRLTLNPLKHIDIVGLITPIILILIGSPFVIGWAKPVPVNYRFIKNKTWGLFSVAIAGVAANILNIIIFSTILKFFFQKENILYVLASILSKKEMILNTDYIFIAFCIFVILINAALAIFNMLPIPPLDGSRVISAFGSRKVKTFLDDMEKYGFLIIIALLYFNVLDFIINPLFKFLLKLVFSDYIGIRII